MTYALYSSQFTLREDPWTVRATAAAAYNPGDVVKLANGLAAFVTGASPIAIGEIVTFQTSGVGDVACATGTTWSDGARVWWTSANLAAAADPGTSGFYLGTARGAKGAGPTVVRVELNAREASDATQPINFSHLTPGTETSGSLVTTGSTWVNFATDGACGGKLLLQNSCNTGEFATWRMRARANNTTATGNGGNSVGTTTCIDASASATAHDYGNLRAVNAVAQPDDKNQTTDATNIVSALYGRIDATGTSIGRRWVEWIDTHATTKADASDYLVRYSHNGTVAIDGLFTVYGGGRLPLYLNVEDATPGFVGAQTGVTTVAKHLKVSINGVAHYIPLCTGTT